MADVESVTDQLDRYRTWPLEEQQQCHEAIIAAFRAFWRTDPSETDFVAHTRGLVLFPAVLYIMATEPVVRRLHAEGVRS